VNVEELVYYVRNFSGWLNVEYRVGGDIDTLRSLLAAGVPVMIEEGFPIAESYWPNDDRWAGHYLLLTGYDDASQSFVTQDAFAGPDRWVSYQDLDRTWQQFNRVFIMVFLPEQTDTVKAVLGADWDPDVNRQNALTLSQQETVTDSQNAYAWFNLGTNQVYFERYKEAAMSYDKAREIGLPQRMLRYQFGPFIAYFHSLRTDDLLALTTYALGRTPNSEEALLWQGWGLFRKNDRVGALESFQKALEARPGYDDALYAINYVQSN
jgi:tetratricopeptide (TPR) repeat protein